MMQVKQVKTTRPSVESFGNGGTPAYAGGLSQAYQVGKRVSFICIIANALLAIAKLLTGYLARSTALMADGVNNLCDIVISVFVYMGMRIAEQEPDAKHPYGHGKAESVAGKAVSVALVMVGVYMLIDSVVVMARGDYAVPASVALWVAAVSIVVKESMFQYTIWHGRRLNSSSLMADAWNHRSDALATIAALLGIIIAIKGGKEWAWCDPAAAGIVAVFIVATGVSLFRQTADELMDAMVDPATMQRISGVALQVDQVKVVETLRVRKSGLGMLADLHIEVDPAMTVEEGHRVAHIVKALIQKEMPAVSEVTIHIEPWYPEGPKFKRDHTPPDKITPTNV